ncbi:uncharacterized protein J3D65DRAFT_604763 [Phyllosticta citribraziliensis]|uniref:Ankyrin repeat protein n=1 Tax=Phyllosticta citribraziliensis TaxID=989973 RepID=A0ABR1LJI4_9PEZI
MHEILRPRDAPYSLWELMSPRFVSRFLCHLSETEDQKSRHTFASFLKLCLDEWLPPRNESKYTRYELAYQLCNIAHQQAGETFHQICDVYFPFYQLPEERCKDVKFHLAIAAIYLKKEQYVKDHLLILLQSNMKSEFFGTPLHAACAAGDLSLVRSLLQNGADPNERSLLAWYPIEIAVLNNNVEIVRELLRNDLFPIICNIHDARLCAFLCAMSACDHAPDGPSWWWSDNIKNWVLFLRATYNAADVRQSLIPLRVNFVKTMEGAHREFEEFYGGIYEPPEWGDKHSPLEIAHDENLMRIVLRVASESLDCHGIF